LANPNHAVIPAQYCIFKAISIRTSMGQEELLLIPLGIPQESIGVECIPDIVNV
jgi:hypothetical protein